MKLLLTAFDPFGGDKVNPALEAVKLVSEKVRNVEVTKIEVPTVFRKSIATVAAAIAKEKPDAVLCIGQAGGRYDITPERVAINLDDARIKDNEGNQPIDVPIYEDGVKSTICCGIVPWYYTRIPSDELACFRLPGHPSWDITVSYPTTGYLSTGAREFIRLASEWWKTIQPDQI